MKFEVRNEADSVVAHSDDRKEALAMLNDLPAGTYTLFKNMGSVTIEERTEAVVRRTRFESTTKRPRAPKLDEREVQARSATPIVEPPEQHRKGDGLLSRLRG